MVIGQHAPDYATVLLSLASGLGLDFTVRLIDVAPDKLFHSYLEHADIFINLRFPPTEGSSASCIEQMLSGRPVIVTGNRFFSEIPGDYVWKISLDEELAGLSAALRVLSYDSETWKLMGERARAEAQREFRAGNYARSLLNLAQEVGEAAPVLRAADRLATELKLLGVTAVSPIPGALAAEIHSLFCRPSGDEST